jgi:tetratricopeptide (TPR) repeat protein
MRQIKEQARREQAYRLAQEEMARLEIRSDTLNDKINELAKPTLELTEAEQEMLKRPVITLMDADAETGAGTISAAVEVLKPQADSSLAGEPAPSSSPADEPAPAPAPEESTAADASEATADTGVTMPPEVAALINEARDQFVRGNFSGAEMLYQQFLELQPENVVALANLGVSQFRQGKLTAAQLALEKAIKVSPDDAFSLTTLGAVMIEQNRIDDAIAYLERANSAVADDPITLNYLGVASSQIGQFGKAEQALRRAVTVKPDYAEAHFNLAVIYATAKPPSIALAKRHYEKALELGAGPDKRLAAMLKGDSGS